MGISHSKVLVYDRGYYTYIAEAIAKQAAETWIYTPILGQQPRSREDQMGSGLDGVEKIDDFEEYKNKTDLLVFPGEFDGEICNRMWEEGRRAFGSGLSSEFEIDRMLFLDTLKEVGLTPIKTYRAEGFDDAIEYFKKNDNKTLWVKTPYTRGDFDTIKFESLATFMPWIEMQRVKLGKGASETIELLIQDDFPIDNGGIESGGDRYIVNGKRTPKGFIGYEGKDKWYIYRVTSEFPDIIDDIDKKMEKVFKDKGYRGAWSSEFRANKDGVKRFTDATARFGSPPGQGFVLSYTTFPQDVEDVANGKMPKMKEKASHGAIIILTSWFNQDNEVCVEYPKEIEDNVKLQHNYKHEGLNYCLPNDAHDGFFGAVVAIGNSAEEAANKANEIAKQVRCVGLEYSEINITEMKQIIKDGEKHGINI